MDFGEINIFNRVVLKDKAFFARQIATMLESGLAIDKSLKIFIGQTNNKFFKKILYSVLKDVEAGMSFSEAIKRHEEVFDDIFVSVVVSGEAVGKLSEVLTNLAETLEKNNTFMGKIKSAFYYPGFVLVVMLVIGFIMVTQVIPPLKEIFNDFGSDIPWTTKTLISISDFIINYWWVVFLILIGMVVGLYAYYKTSDGQRLYSRIVIGVPGGIGKDVYMNRFCSTLSMLLTAGTPVVKALDITANVMGNVIYTEVIKETSEQMERGIAMSVPISKHSEFDELVHQMIRVGEETGKVDEVLRKLSEYYEEEGNRKVSGISSLIEPALIVVIGGGVAFIVFSIILPIYQLVQIQ